jgi:hypothetical protein
MMHDLGERVALAMATFFVASNIMLHCQNFMRFMQLTQWWNFSDCAKDNKRAA